MSGLAYLDFDLLFAPAATGYTVQVVGSPAGEGMVLVPATVVDLATELADPVAELVRGRADREMLGAHSAMVRETGDMPRALGARLFEAVFADGVGTCLERSLDAAERAGRGLRIRLRLASAPELAALPWECLYHPGRDLFFARSNRTPVVRYLDLPLPTPTLTVQPPLNILVIIADALDHARLDVEAEWLGVEAELAPLARRGLVSLDRLDEATVAQLQRRLRRRTYHVLHFVGHGDFDEVDRVGMLLFEDEAGLGHAVSAEHLVGLLRDHPSLRLVVLNACEAGHSSSGDVFAGVAQSLARGGLPATIAMQNRVSDRAAVLLAREFYSALADSYPVDAALAEARKALFNRGFESEWSTPVLFMRSPDGRIFDFAGAAGAGSDTVPIVVPPQPDQPPSTRRLVGREAELAAIEARLADTRALLLTGMPGVGKRSMAALLAERAGTGTVFWHEPEPGLALRGVLLKLAAFLAHQGNSGLWQMMQGATHASATVPEALLLDYAVQGLRGLGAWVGLIGVDCLGDGDLERALLKRMVDMAREGGLTVIMSAEASIPSLSSIPTYRMEGLVLEDAHRLLLGCGLRLDDSAAQALWHQTSGHPELLLLAANAVRPDMDADALAAALVADTDVERFLVLQVDRGLSAEERGLMQALSILSGFPGTRDALEAVSAGRNLRVPLTALRDRQLVNETRGSFGRAFALTPLLQVFFEDQLSRDERQSMHALAGAYFAEIEPDPFQAAMHFEQAGDRLRAAELATGDLWSLINRGYARRLGELLERLSPQGLPVELWARVLITRGRVWAELGEGERSRQSYRAVLDLEQSTGDTIAPRTYAEACLGMAELLQHDFESSRDPIPWLERGLDFLGEGDDLLRAAMLAQIGSALINAADLPGAERYTERALSLMPESSSRLRARALINLGIILCARGDVAGGNSVTEEGMAIASALGDDHTVLLALGNLAIEKWQAGLHEEGLVDMRRALAIAEQLGVAGLRAQQELNLGVMLLQQGTFDEARRYLECALAAAQAYGWKETEIGAQSSLADLHLQQGNLDSAEEILAALEPMAVASGAEGQLVEIRGHVATLKALHARGDAVI